MKLINFKIPPHPKAISLDCDLVLLEPLCVRKHAKDLFSSNALDKKKVNWHYLPYGPFEQFDDYSNWLRDYEGKQDPVFFAIVRKSDNQALGVASYLSIKPLDGSIEVGHLNYSPLLQQTKLATQSMYLMMKWVFENGYRRYEWKCNALNIKSRIAAQRLGFSFEGVFRQAGISKGKNRDTAWFAIINREWHDIEKCFLKYLAADNYDKQGKPIRSLSVMTKPYLYKLDSFELS